MEIKIKNNKDRTLKFRAPGCKPEDVSSLIYEHTPYSTAELQEVLQITYNRITLLHKERNEKLTLDSSLVFRKDEHDISFNHHIFAEVKTTDAHHIEFCQIMKLMGIRSGSLSKYCLGVMSFYPGIKQNNFKLSLKNILKNDINAIT
jgi:hypothetical protein